MKRTVIQLLEQAAEKFKEVSYVNNKTDTGWNSKTFGEVYSEAECFAAWLINEGLNKEDCAAILSEGRQEWVIGEFGILLAGGISVPLSIKLLPEEIPFRLNHSESKMILLSRNTLEAVAAVYEKLENDVTIVFLDDDEKFTEELSGRYGIDSGRIKSFSSALRQGREILSKNPEIVSSVKDRITEDDTVTVSYTSGTTGNPKGIMLTHKNYYVNVHDSIAMFNIPLGYSTLLILPCDHSFAHTVGLYAALLRGITLYFVDARGGPMGILRNIPINLKEANPDFLLTVPALTGNFMKKISEGIEKQGGFVRSLFNSGVSAAVKRNGDGYRRKPFFIRLFTYIPYKLADVLVFSKVRAIFGNKLKFCVGGGALLDIKQQEFFKAIGAPIYQGYGLTEAAPVISSNTFSVHKLGTSGKIAPSIECRIVADGKDLPKGEKGEVVIRGDNVMKGYLKNPDATRETVRDGWLYTGDLGYIDEDDFLVVVGREKALLISEDGEKYSPEEIEEAITNSSDIIHQVMIYNDHKKYTTALVTLDNNKLQEMIAKDKIDGPQELLDTIQASFFRFQEEDAYRGKFPKQWLPKTFQILGEPFSEKNKMINSTMKMVRYKICETHKSLLDY
ncbi:MAG: AMP-dependent synthetase/ligase, partial [Spirochaetia bacterium]